MSAEGARVVGAIAEVLPEPSAAELIASTLRWEDPGAGAVLDDLADRPIGGVLATDRVARALASGADGHVGPEAILPHALRLGARGDLTGGLLSAALTERHGQRAGWPPEWRNLLRGLRRHPSPDVAFAVHRIHTAAE